MNEHGNVALLEHLTAPFESDELSLSVPLGGSGSVVLPARFTRSLVALVALPFGTPVEPLTGGLPAHSRVIGTGFFIYMNGLFVTAAHLAADCQLDTLVAERRAVALTFAPNRTYYAQRVLAIAVDDENDVAVGCINPPLMTPVPYLPLSSEPPPGDLSDCRCLIAGFQDTDHEHNAIRLWPALFHGGPPSLQQGSCLVSVPGHMSRRISGPFVVVRAKARPGISGAPVLLCRRVDGPGDRAEWAGQVQALASWRTDLDEGEALLRCVPTSRCLDLKLIDPVFRFEGRTLRELAQVAQQSHGADGALIQKP